MKFEDLGIEERLLKLLKKNGITEPTPVQERAIPILKTGKDIIAQAQTGTGKTLAFMLPILENLDISKGYIQALIITPTRELAIQITQEAKKYAEGGEESILAAYGGQDVEGQIKKLKNNVNIVIGTPGRLLDHIRRKTINLNRVSMVVLDEADLMLDMGFLQEVKNIFYQIPYKKQTMLFSATISKGVKNLSKKFLKNPERVMIQSKEVALNNIKQIVVETNEKEKLDSLCNMLNEMNPFMAIIFCKTKNTVMALNEELGTLGYKSDELHGDMSQRKRERTMKIFRQADLPILIATDVAARGLDITGVTHVFNYEVPGDIDTYIHRVGRTGRAGQEGVAVTFVTQKEKIKFQYLENNIKGNFEKRKFGNLDSIESYMNIEDVNRYRKSISSQNKKKINNKRIPGNRRRKSGSY